MKDKEGTERTETEERLVGNRRRGQRLMIDVRLGFFKRVL